MTLYEMTDEAKKLYEVLTDSDIDEETRQQILEDTLEGLGTKEKLESYCIVYNQLRADAEMVKAEKKRLEATEKYLGNNADRMLSGMLAFMEAKGSKRENVGKFTLSVRESKAVDDTTLELTKLPKEYFKVAEPKLDKVKLRADLIAGNKVEGAKLITRRSVSIK